MPIKMPEGKFMSTVKVGEKGQIVIPKEVRDMFGIEPGDMLVLLADRERGIAIVDNSGLLEKAQSLAGFAAGGEKKGEKP